MITLSYSDTLEIQAADAKPLVTLLHLRDISEKSKVSFSIVSDKLISWQKTKSKHFGPSRQNNP